MATNLKDNRALVTVLTAKHANFLVRLSGSEHRSMRRLMMRDLA
jgi:hypothetical protein